MWHSSQVSENSPEFLSPWRILAVILLAVILPRLAGIGDFIHMDEGYHAFIAQYAWHGIASGAGFPQDISGFKLYPLIFSWLWALPGNPVIWFRVTDMLFAALAGWAFCIMLARESGSPMLGLLLAFAFLLGLNLEAAVDSGFKNSFSPAFLCLFCAVNLAREATPHSSSWFWAGALTALAILFRETFGPFVFLACISIAITKNWQALWRFIAGGIAGAVLVAIISAAARGQIWGLIEWYLTYGKIYGPEGWRTLEKFHANGLKAITIYWPLLAIFVLAIAALFRLPGRRFTGRAWFWLAAAALPLMEPFLKIGFLYHFSVCLPGIAGFCAFALGKLPHKPIRARNMVFGATALAGLLMLPIWLPHLKKLPVTIETIKNYPQPGWPHSLSAHSTTLQAAEMARKLAGMEGTVASSGFAYFLFPAGGFLPPEIGLGDISRTLIFSDMDEDRFLKKLLGDPPDVIIIGNAIRDHSAIFRDQLENILQSKTEYMPAAVIPPDLDKNYGWLGYTLYRRKPVE